MEVIFPFVMVNWSFLATFFLCECGERVMNQFDEFHDEIYQCNWYSFPIEIQKMLVIAMSISQQPAIIQGFGNLLCTRDTFKRVIFFFFFEIK